MYIFRDLRFPSIKVLCVLQKGIKRHIISLKTENFMGELNLSLRAHQKELQIFQTALTSKD